MKRNFLLGLIIIVILSLGLTSCQSPDKQQLAKDGSVVVEKIESFRKDKGRLPESLTEVDKNMNPEDPFFYTKESPTKYKLSAILDLTHFYEYDSETKEWKVVS